MSNKSQIDADTGKDVNWSSERAQRPLLEREGPKGPLKL